MRSYNAWRRRRILRRYPVADSTWAKAYRKLPLLAQLTAEEDQRLRELAVLLMHEKSFEGARGFQITEDHCVLIALQAGLPILNLGLDWYAGWISIIVYPTAFLVEREEQDRIGVVHQIRRPLCGESWLRGPVILAWPHVEAAGVIDGHNLVIHEFVHKLDMLDGAANGIPPLHRGMHADSWTRAFSAAFEDLRSQAERGDATVIDAYAAESPAEFFAVVSEVFFEQPQVLRQAYPEVYTQLSAFYRPMV